MNEHIERWMEDVRRKGEEMRRSTEKNVTRNLATKVCAHSRNHTAGRGVHDAYAWGPCSDHERIVAETVKMLRSLGMAFPPE